MSEQFLDQINSIIRVCQEKECILVTDRNGIVEYMRVPAQVRDSFHLPEAVGCHILELYPELDEETSTILQVLKTGRPSYRVRQNLTNVYGEEVVLDSTTLPVIVNGEVRGAVDSTRFYRVGQLEVRAEEAGHRLTTLEEIITQDPQMEALKDRVRAVAGLDTSVLICGETGTGKELFAQALHTEGRRAGKPFITQNCAAIPPNLLESIFFGTEKGSYTGAVSRKGLFELADGGTLFLDEINSMDVGLQAKLLKALEEKTVRRVGGERDICFDVRVVAAMTEPPQKVLAEGRMREDLYYRIGVIRLQIPPLRERPGDILPLARLFARQIGAKTGRGISGLSNLAESLFQQYAWPGNVRELRNTMEGACATAEGSLLRMEDVQDILWSQSGKEEVVAVLPPQAAAELLDTGLGLEQLVGRYEQGLIENALARYKTVSAAARALGISRQSLQYKMQKFLPQNNLQVQDNLRS